MIYAQWLGSEQISLAERGLVFLRPKQERLDLGTTNSVAAAANRFRVKMRIELVKVFGRKTPSNFLHEMSSAFFGPRSGMWGQCEDSNGGRKCRRDIIVHYRVGGADDRAGAVAAQAPAKERTVVGISSSAITSEDPYRILVQTTDTVTTPQTLEDFFFADPIASVNFRKLSERFAVTKILSLSTSSGKSPQSTMATMSYALLRSIQGWKSVPDLLPRFEKGSWDPDDDNHAPNETEASRDAVVPKSIGILDQLSLRSEPDLVIKNIKYGQVSCGIVDRKENKESGDNVEKCLGMPLPWTAVALLYGDGGEVEDEEAICGTHFLGVTGDEEEIFSFSRNTALQQLLGVGIGRAERGKLTLSSVFRKAMRAFFAKSPSSPVLGGTWNGETSERNNFGRTPTEEDQKTLNLNNQRLEKLTKVLKGDKDTPPLGEGLRVGEGQQLFSPAEAETAALFATYLARRNRAANFCRWRGRPRPLLVLIDDRVEVDQNPGSLVMGMLMVYQHFLKSLPSEDEDLGEEDEEDALSSGGWDDIDNVRRDVDGLIVVRVHEKELHPLISDEKDVTSLMKGFWVDSLDLDQSIDILHDPQWRNHVGVPAISYAIYSPSSTGGSVGEDSGNDGRAMMIKRGDMSVPANIRTWHKGFFSGPYGLVQDKEALLLRFVDTQTGVARWWRKIPRT